MEEENKETQPETQEEAKTDFKTYNPFAKAQKKETKEKIAEFKEIKTVNHEPKEEEKESKPFSPRLFLRNLYVQHYKKLLIITFIILFLSIGQIVYQTATTGDFINKGISLKGGAVITISTEKIYDITNLQEELSSKFKNKDISVKQVLNLGKPSGITISVNVDEKEIDLFRDEVENIFNISSKDYSVEFIGSSLGASFFKETISAMIVAFILMSIVVFIWFRNFIPSIAVILSAFSDIIVTMATVNLMGMKISTAGIAAFLMLIGYSVDTDILLNTKVLKKKDGTVLDRTFVAMRTGIMMTITTIIATTAAIIFTQSEVIKQIMTILLIGLFYDMIFTWIQNAGILRIYMDRRERLAKKREEM